MLDELYRVVVVPNSCIMIVILHSLLQKQKKEKKEKGKKRKRKRKKKNKKKKNKPETQSKCFFQDTKHQALSAKIHQLNNNVAGCRKGPLPADLVDAVEAMGREVKDVIPNKDELA